MASIVRKGKVDVLRNYQKGSSGREEAAHNLTVKIKTPRGTKAYNVRTPSRGCDTPVCKAARKIEHDTQALLAPIRDDEGKTRRIMTKEDKRTPNHVSRESSVIITAKGKRHKASISKNGPRKKGKGK